MDKISAQQNVKVIAEEQKRDIKFEEAIASSKSLTRYEGTSCKALLPQIAATLMAVSLHVALGFSMSFSGILIPALDKVQQNGTDDDGQLYATQSESTWIASIYVIITPIGSVTSGLVADRWGRLWTIKLSVIPFALGWCLIASAQSIPQILLGRLLTGFATPWSSIPATVYVSEIARADIRGSLIVLAPTLASTGMFLCFLKGLFLNWRTVAWLCNAYVLLPVILIFFVPESPMWLVSKGKLEEAAKSLRWLNRYQPQPINKSESLAELQLQALQREHQKKLEHQARYGNMGVMGIIKAFLKPNAYKPMILLTGMFTFQMFSGVYITLFYSVTFLQELGSTINPYLSSTVICSTRMIMALSNAYLLKTFNRRTLLIISGICMAFCMTCSGFSTYWIKSGTSDKTYLPVIFMFLYVTTMMLGLLTIPWTMMCELFPLEIRGVANSVAYSVGNLILFASLQSFYGLLYLFDGYAGIQWFFAGVSILATVYTYIFMPETNNKKLSEIGAYFEQNFVYVLSRRNKHKNNNKTPLTRRIAKRGISRKAGQDEKLINNNV